jgi:hypothetical protein
MKALPGTDQITSSVAGVFSAARTAAGEAILGALVPHQESPLRMISLIPEFEMDELCQFVNQFRSYIELRPERARENSRCKVLIYCHILEAEFPATVIWNLLRLVNGDGPSWMFFDLPGTRYKEILKLSDARKLSVGTVLDSLWCNKLRNAFSHAQYLLHDDGCLLGTRNISPVTANAVRPSDLPQGDGNPYFFRPDEVNELFVGALAYLKVFIETYKSVTAPFKDGQWHDIPTGPIRWDSERGWWSAR